LQKKFYSHPKIKQFRDVVHNVSLSASYEGKNEEGQPIYNELLSKPCITFYGTTKMHGSQGSLIFLDKESYYTQSRTRILSLTSDNYGFCAWTKGINSLVIEKLKKAIGLKNFAIYGEWAGEGIQKGVAIAFIPRFWTIFAIRNLDTDEWIELNCLNSIIKDLNKERIFVSHQYEQYTIEVNFEKPELVIEQLQQYTLNVEEQCPVGKFFNITECKTGEGIVWVGKWRDQIYRFKVKGEKHSVSKVKKLVSVDVEKIANVREFVEMTVTENRLLQGIEWLKEQGKELNRYSTGDYLRWLFNDILSEEADTLKQNGLISKDVGSEISKKARIWWFDWLDNNFS